MNVGETGRWWSLFSVLCEPKIHTKLINRLRIHPWNRKYLKLIEPYFYLKNELEVDPLSTLPAIYWVKFLYSISKRSRKYRGEREQDLFLVLQRYFYRRTWDTLTAKYMNTRYYYRKNISWSRPQSGQPARMLGVLVVVMRMEKHWLKRRCQINRQFSEFQSSQNCSKIVKIGSKIVFLR